MLCIFPNFHLLPVRSCFWRSSIPQQYYCFLEFHVVSLEFFVCIAIVYIRHWAINFIKKSIFSLHAVFLAKRNHFGGNPNLAKVKKWPEPISLPLWTLTSRYSSDSFLSAMKQSVAVLEIRADHVYVCKYVCMYVHFLFIKWVHYFRVVIRGKISLFQSTDICYWFSKLSASLWISAFPILPFRSPEC